MTKFSGPSEDVEVREPGVKRGPGRKPWFNPKVAVVFMALGAVFALKDLVTALIRAFAG